MNLLLIMPSLPFPPVSGNSMIALNHIRQLSRRHTLDLIAFRGGDNTGDLGDLPDCCRHIELVDRPPHWKMFVNLLTGIAGYAPFGVTRLKSSAMASTIHRALAEGGYDAVIFQLSEMAQFRPDSLRAPSVWNLEDPPILKYQRMLAIEPWYAKPLAWDRIARRKHYEKQQAPRFDRVLFVNREDASDYARLLPDASIDWVPSAIDVTSFCPSTEVPRREGMIVITGNMFHKPNVDAVEHFCRNIFPLVRKQVESATLCIVGSRPAPAVTRWAADPDIEVTSFVPDVRPYLRQARVSICPVRLRIGTQTKVLEALACGTPVVTTSAGNHGIGGVSGEHLYVADDPQEFAARVVSLLRRERWNELSESGRRFVVQNFTWEKSAARLEEILERLVAAPAPKVATV